MAMRELEIFPLEYHSVAPGAEFTQRLAGEHTGGPFVSPDGEELWKPLDCLPYPNALHRVATREDEILELLADTPGFPRNWRVEQANGRGFLVRKRAYLAPEEEALRLEQILHIEEALLTLNGARWTLNDRLQVAIDPDTYEPFVLDLSAACPMTWADDWRRFQDWAQALGATDLIALRQHARHAVGSASWRREHPDHQWIYGSWHRPYGPFFPGKDIPGALYVDANKGITDFHTWVIVPAPLAPEIVARYQLRLGWRPIVYRTDP